MQRIGRSSIPSGLIAVDLACPAALVGIGAILFSTTKLDWIDPSSAHSIYASFAVFLSVGWLVWGINKWPHFISPVHVLACGLTVGFSARGLVGADEATWISAPDESVYILTIMVCQVGIAALYAGFWSLGRSAADATISRLIDKYGQSPAVLMPVLVCCLIVEVAGYAYLQSSGLFLAHLAYDESVPGMLQSIAVIGLPAIRIAAIILAASFWLSTSPRMQVVGVAVLIAQIMLSFFLGRFHFLLTILIPLGMLLLGTKRVGIERRKLVALAAILVCGVILVGWPMYQAVRVYALAEGQEGAGVQIDWLLGSAVPHAVSNFSLGAVYGSDSDYLANVAARTGLADFVAEVIYSQAQGESWLKGEVLLTAVLLAVPRIFWPDKPEMSEELLVVEHYGLPPFDHTTSLVGLGLADFGIAGVVGYFFLLGTIMRLLARHAANTGSVVVMTGLFTLLTWMMFALEGDIAFYTVILRLWPLLFALEIFLLRPKRKRRNEMVASVDLQPWKASAGEEGNSTLVGKRV